MRMWMQPSDTGGGAAHAERAAAVGAVARTLQLQNEKNEELVVVARLKERPCLLAWDASLHGRT